MHMKLRDYPMVGWEDLDGRTRGFIPTFGYLTYTYMQIMDFLIVIVSSDWCQMFCFKILVLILK